MRHEVIGTALSNTTTLTFGSASISSTILTRSRTSAGPTILRGGLLKVTTQYAALLRRARNHHMDNFPAGSLRPPFISPMGKLANRHLWKTVFGLGRQSLVAG